MASSEIKMKMSLDSSGVSSGIAKAKGSISSFATSSISKLKSIISSGLGPLGAAFGVMGIKKLVDDMTELGRSAERLGISVESFQRLAFAAKQTGVDTERLADAMKDLDVKLQDGIMRGGSFAELIQELGMDMAELAAMPADQRMLAFADAIQDASGSLSRFGADEFGDAMFELLPLLELGSEGILELGRSATIMTQDQIDAAERASREVDGHISNMVAQLSIWIGEGLKVFEFMVAGITQAALEVGNVLRPLGGILKGVFTFDLDLIKQSFGELTVAAEESGRRINDAFNEVLDEQLAEKHKAELAKMTKAELARLKVEQDARKANAKIEEANQKKIDRIKDQSHKEQMKHLELEQSTERELFGIIEKQKDLKKELAEIDPFTDEKEQAEKQLELDQAITEEKKLRAQLAKEAAEAEEKALSQALEYNLAIAEASGDQEAIRNAQQRLQIESEIAAMVDRTGMSEEQARRVIEAKNKRLQEQKDLRLQLVKAEADGNDALAHELQKRIDKQDEAQALMKEFNISLEEAVALAGQLAAVRAGPDLNQSGFVTPREQREFDRQQKAKQREANKRFAEEKRTERERGGGIRNVSVEKRKTRSIADRMADAKERRLQQEENRAINRERDPAKRAAMIKEADKRIAERAAERAKKAERVIPDGLVKGRDGLGDKKPEPPKDPAEQANDLLGKQLTELQAIKKALQC